ncbi:MAG TPA: YihY/virulence factor BrkB family protein [Dehalococcoidia bacterium]|nr:YihY/virulence factor BrkB family protein [Dehalococcoidia bacterium]
MKRNGKGLLSYGRRLAKEVSDDDLSGLAAELAYRFFLALFPFFVFLAAAGGLAADLAGVQNPADEVMDWLGDTLPEDASSVLRTEMEGVIEERDEALLSAGILGAIWAASSGVGSVIKGMNRVYEVKEARPLWKRYAMSVGLTVFGGLAIIAAFVILVGGQVGGLALAGEIGLRGAAAALFTLARWPVVVGLLLLAVAFLYWLAPNADLPFKWITPGAALFTVGWLLVSFLFGLYVANFASYGATYGTLGGVVVLMVWFYLTAFLLLLGAQVNAVLAREAAPSDVQEGLPRASREHGRATGETGGRAAPERAESEMVTASGPREPAPARIVPALGLLVAALTLWKVARGRVTAAGTRLSQEVSNV